MNKSFTGDTARGNSGAIIGICIFLVAITWLVFGQTLGHEFINLDDPRYVLKNPDISKGLSLHGVAWVLTHSHSYNWHPLTTITHMLDCQLYGLRAGGHHLTNVLLHTIAVLLLFLVLRAMTGALWASAFVAAVFAIHPLRAESVAWVAERKDVLSGVFFMLTLAAYLRYVRRPSFASYLLVGFIFALGLMSKPMLVTLPFVLLLLDYWPLRRFPSQVSAKNNADSLHWWDRQPITQKLLLEKLPLLLLSAVLCVATVVVQTHSVRNFPVPLRIYNALVSCIAYVWQAFWPARLAVFYPYPAGSLSIWVPLLATAVLFAVSYMAWTLRKQRPYVITGWLWYLGMLVPVIGLLQVGMQARADRYTYLPHIGLYVLVTWAVMDLSRSWRYRREILSILALATIGVLSWRAQIQTSYWKNSELLWARTLAVTSNNAFAHENLGYLMLEKWQLDDAISHFQEALKIRPDYSPGSSDPDNAHVHTSYGSALMRKGRVAEGLAHYEKSLAIAPHSVVTLNNLALVLSTSSEARFRNGPRAVKLAEQADQLPGRKNATIVRTLAAAYAESGRFDDATEAAERALKLALAQGDSAVASELRMEIDLYRLKLPRRGGP